jgi:hypothetical protein
MDGAYHVVIAHEIGAPDDTKHNGTPKGAYEAFNSLLWGELNEWRAPNGDAPDVGKYIVTDDERGGDPEPNKAFENVVHDEMASVQTLAMNRAMGEHLTSKRR